MQTLEENFIFDGKILKVYNNKVKIKDGEYYRALIIHNGGSSVLCEKDGKFLFVKQYRYAMKEYTIEIPAGLREENENPEVTAIREAGEEGGLKPLNLTLITNFAVSPGYDSEKVSVYYANEFENVNTNLDEDEELNSFWVDVQTAYKMVESGEIYDGKTVIAILWHKSQFFNKKI